MTNGPSTRVAIQGELGSNSHMAALAMLTGEGATSIEIVSCAASAEVFDRVATGSADAAVLPIENSLHGSVAEHYDLLLAHPVKLASESLLHIRHHVIAAHGVALADVHRVLSHPVALSQCRLWLAAHPEIEAMPFYDTAGSVKHLIAGGLRDVAGIAPELAARQYGAEVLVADIQDHAENFTRFHLLLPEAAWTPAPDANKSSLAFAVEHRPGTLVLALEELARAGLNLTKIESRPVHGRPWEYVFFVDVGFTFSSQITGALARLERHCQMLRELGRYVAA
jgi:prephenate dehydratase